MLTKEASSPAKRRASAPALLGGYVDAKLQSMEKRQNKLEKAFRTKCALLEEKANENAKMVEVVVQSAKQIIAQIKQPQAQQGFTEKLAELTAAKQGLEAKTTELTETQEEFKFAFTSSNNQLRFMLLDFVLCFLSVVVLDEPIIMQFIKQYVAMPAMAIKLSSFALITGVVLITYSIKPDLLGGNVVVDPSKYNGAGAPVSSVKKTA